MNDSVILAIVIAVVIAVSGIVIYVQNDSNPSSPIFQTTSVILKSGTVLNISSSDTKMIGGAEIHNFTTNGYYAQEYRLNVGNYSIISGSWESSGKTLFWIFGSNEIFMETPLPEETHGILNQTLLPAEYTIVIGGYPGDTVSITSPIALRNYTPYQIGSFSIASGVHISSPKTYSFYLNEPGLLVGAFTTGGGEYSYSLHNSNGNGFGVMCFNTSAKPTLNSFNISWYSQTYSPGYYNLTFSEGTFYVNQNMEFLYYYDNST